MLYNYGSQQCAKESCPSVGWWFSWLRDVLVEMQHKQRQSQSSGGRISLNTGGKWLYPHQLLNIKVGRVWKWIVWIVLEDSVHTCRIVHKLWLVFCLHIVPWLLSEKCELYLSSCLENVGRTLVLSGECRLYFGSVWRMWAVLWFCLENASCTLVQSGECGLYFGSVWRMQAVLWFCLENTSCILVLSGECRLYIISWLENAGCILSTVWMQAVYWLLSGGCRCYSCREMQAVIWLLSCMKMLGCS